MLNPMYVANMNEQQRTWFYAEYQAAEKNEAVGVCLALFLGVFGIHKFYMGETAWGVVYILLSWTGISAFLGFIECFLMPGRVRAYNAAQAQIIATGILSAGGQAYASSAPPTVAAANLTPVMCSGCGSAVQPGASFCARCGAGMAAAV